MTMTLSILRKILGDIDYIEGGLTAGERDNGDLWLRYSRYGKWKKQQGELIWGPPPDKSKWISGRKWLISRHSTKSEVVQTAFKAVMTFEEHEIRESFTYKGERIFGPHFDVDFLAEACKLDATEKRK